MSLIDILKQYSAPAPHRRQILSGISTPSRVRPPRKISGKESRQRCAPGQRLRLAKRLQICLHSPIPTKRPGSWARSCRRWVLPGPPPRVVGSSAGCLGTEAAQYRPPPRPRKPHRCPRMSWTPFVTKAEQQDGSIVDRLGNFYAQRPTLVKTLGVAALGVVMAHMSTQQRGYWTDAPAASGGEPGL